MFRLGIAEKQGGNFLIALYTCGKGIALNIRLFLLG